MARFCFVRRMGILVEVASMKNVTYPQLVTSTLVLSPSSLNESPEMCVEVPFNLIGKLKMALLTGQSWHINVLKCWYTSEGQEQGIWLCFADGLTQ